MFEECFHRPPGLLLTPAPTAAARGLIAVVLATRASCSNNRRRSAAPPQSQAQCRPLLPQCRFALRAADVSKGVERQLWRRTRQHLQRRES
jgi:hypothetical protein